MNMNIGEVTQVPQLTVVLDHVPGALARMAAALEQADVNIDGFCCIEGSDENMPVKIMVDKPEVAKKAIEATGSAVSIEQCIAIHLLQDKPGFMASLGRKLGAANININSIYQTSSGRGNLAIVYLTVDPSRVTKTMELLKTL